MNAIAATPRRGAELDRAGTGPTTCPSSPRPGTRTARSSAGTHSAGVRNRAEIEKTVCAPSGLRSLGAVRAFHAAVTSERERLRSPAPTRKSTPAASSSPAMAAPVTPPSAYDACSHCSTGRCVATSTRCAATFRYTSISPLPAPTKRNAQHHELGWAGTRSTNEPTASTSSASGDRARQRQPLQPRGDQRASRTTAVSDSIVYRPPMPALAEVRGSAGSRRRGSPTRPSTGRTARYPASSGSDGAPGLLGPGAAVASRSGEKRAGGRARPSGA